MKNNGFTMVEVLAVIMIIALIMIIAIPAYNNIANNIKDITLDNKEKAIASAMLKHANRHLLDDIKTAGNTTCAGVSCCKQYDLYLYVVENGIFAAEDTLVEPLIINPVNNKKLTGCVKAAYNLDKFILETTFDRNCVMDEPSADCES